VKRVLFLCAAYYLASLFGRALVFPTTGFPILRPSNTVLLVALLLSAPRQWSWILSIAFPVHLIAQSTASDLSPAAESLRYLGNCVFALVTATALRRCRLGDMELNNLRQALIFAGVTASSVALVSLPIRMIAFWIDVARLPSWSLLFLSNLLAYLIATPCLVIGLRRGREIMRKASFWQCAEFVFLTVMLLVGGATVFGIVPAAIGSVPALFISPLPFLLWAAVRFGTSGLSFSFLIFSLTAILNTLDGFGPFVTPSVFDSVFRLQVFLLSLYVPLLVVASVVEERRAKEKALTSSEARYRAIVEDQTELICRLLPDGTYTFVNDAYCQYFRRSREELLGQTFWQFLPPEGHQAAREFLSSITPGHAVATREHEVIAPGGEIRWQQWRDRGFFDQEGRLVEYQAVGRDITERKLAEAAARESEERFRVLANAAPVMLWMSGPDKLCTDFNRPWLEFTGRPIEAELGNGWADSVHPDDLDECFKTYVDAFDRREPFRMEYRLRRHDGEYRWILDIGVPRQAPDGSFAGYIGSAVDVTEQKHARAALSSLSQRLMDAHEQERTWVARELHDDICQQIVAMTIQLHTLSQAAPADTVEIRSRIRELSKRLAQLGGDVQAISHRLHSSKLEYIGIVRAAAGFCDEISSQHAVEVDFSHEGIPPNLPQATAIALFRVLQEALKNAIKHSGARHFEVKLAGTANEIQLEVIDHGIGFDQDASIQTHGLGLISMQERLNLINGKLSIESRPGAGTTIRARVPVSVSDAGAGGGPDRQHFVKSKRNAAS
jgi:PAS domain S-box-containing protein